MPRTTEAELQAAEAGRPLQATIGTDRFALGPRPMQSARNAASRALALYLAAIPWEAPGGDAEPVTFRLNQVLNHWPVGGEELDYPSASIDDGNVPYQAHSLTPTPLEETLGAYGPGCLLWKTAELVLDFQVDFWTNSEPSRQAIEAGLPRAFNLTDRRAGVLLGGLSAYFHRPVRATLMTHERLDQSSTAYQRERRLRATIRAEIDVVHLRRIVGLDPKVDLDASETAETGN